MATVHSIKPIPALDADTLRKFHARVFRSEPSECWPWLGATAVGYGRFFFRRREFYQATRVAWLIEHGEQPDGFVCHKCDNPICVNPSHLFLGDASANCQDRDSKRRGRNSRKLLCKHGHSLHDALTYRGMRRCRECNRISSADRRNSQKEPA